MSYANHKTVLAHLSACSFPNHGRVIWNHRFYLLQKPSSNSLYFNDMDIIMKKTYRNRILFGISIATVLLGSSCYAPEGIEIHYDGNAKDETYQFDIMMLSEWAGHILPEVKTVRLYADDASYYLLDSVILSSGDICPAGVENCLSYQGAYLDSSSTLPKTLQFPLSILGEHSFDAASNLTVHPFAFDPSIGVECTRLNEDPKNPNIILSRFNELYKLNVSEYTCSYTRSGAISLRNTWDLLKSRSKHDHQIYVGNGDSFGVSQRASALFNDLPTPQMLSLMGFQADTFGNHSFDSKIDYLQSIINYATPEVSNHALGYNYVASNVQHSDILNHWMSHYIATVPSQIPGHDGLKVAFIGALDSSVFATTKTGSFGSIDIDSEMCSIVNEIELAYNENARAFFILGHILTGTESYSHLLDAVFTFSEPLISSSIQNNGVIALPFLPQCESKLVVPLDRLEEAFGVRTLSKLNFKDQSVKEKYAKLIDAIRNEIFTSIIGIIGEATDTPSVQVYYHERSTLKEGSKGIIWNAATSKDSSKINYVSNNLLTEEKNFCNQTHIFDAHPCYELSLSELDRSNLYNHPIYYIQIPSAGINTLQMRVTATLNPSIDNGKEVASSYFLNADEISLYPVVSSLSDAQLKFSKDIIDITEPSYESCVHFFEQDIANVTHDASNSCLEFYRALSQAKQTFTTMSEMKSVDQNDLDISYHALFNTCYDAFSDYVLNETDAAKKRANLELASGFWSCLYTAASNLMCPDGSTFYSPVVYKFDNYLSTTMMQDRSQSTYNTNIISDGFFNYMSAIENDLDISIINSGTLREGDLSEITAPNLSFMIPFDNKLVAAVLTPKQIVEMIEPALNRSYEKRNTDYGGFPSVSRMAVAYRPTPIDDTDNMRIEVTEIWKTDEFGALKELLYLSSLKENYFAKYTPVAGSDEILAEFLDSSTPWLCDQPPLSNCIQMEDGIKSRMKLENGHYYSVKSQRMLSHSYLATAGDDYPNNFGVSDVPTYYDITFRTAVFSYYSGSSSSLDDNNPQMEALCKVQEGEMTYTYTTYDALTPDMMDCILYVNHFYDVTKKEKSRWIPLASDSIQDYLNNRCQVGRLSQ